MILMRRGGPTLIMPWFTQSRYAEVYTRDYVIQVRRGLTVRVNRLGILRALLGDRSTTNNALVVRKQQRHFALVRNLRNDQQHALVVHTQ